jgi:hypothetical protein
VDDRGSIDSPLDAFTVALLASRRAVPTATEGGRVFRGVEDEGLFELDQGATVATSMRAQECEFTTSPN